MDFSNDLSEFWISNINDFLFDMISKIGNFDVENHYYVDYDFIVCGLFFF